MYVSSGFIIALIPFLASKLMKPSTTSIPSLSTVEPLRRSGPLTFADCRENIKLGHINKECWSNESELPILIKEIYRDSPHDSYDKLHKLVLNTVCSNHGKRLACFIALLAVYKSMKENEDATVARSIQIMSDLQTELIWKFGVHVESDIKKPALGFCLEVSQDTAELAAKKFKLGLEVMLPGKIHELADVINKWSWELFSHTMDELFELYKNDEKYGYASRGNQTSDEFMGKLMSRELDRYDFSLSLGLPRDKDHFRRFLKQAVDKRLKPNRKVTDQRA